MKVLLLTISLIIVSESFSNETIVDNGERRREREQARLCEIHKKVPKYFNKNCRGSVSNPKKEKRVPWRRDRHD